MDIKNLGEFAQFAQGHAGDETYQHAITLAGRVADQTELVQVNHGHGKSTLVDSIGVAVRMCTEDDKSIDEAVLAAMHDTLGRFWAHGEAFGQWLESSTIITRTNQTLF